MNLFTKKILIYGFIAGTFIGSILNLLPEVSLSDTLQVLLEINRSSTPYYIVLGLLTIILLLFLKINRYLRIFFIIALVEIIYTEYSISIPRINYASQQCTNTKEISIFYQNVYYLNQHHRDLERQIAELKPDIVALNEMTEAWRRDFNISKDYPYNVSYRRSYSGMLIYSKYPIVAINHFWAGDSKPILHARIKIEQNSQPLNINLVHPSAPYRRYFVVQRNNFLNRIPYFLNKQNGPKILLGDFNTTPFSPILYKVAQQAKLNPAIYGQPFFFSWCLKQFPLYCAFIDHFFYNESIQIVNAKREKNTGSDHFPFLYTIKIIK